MEAPWRIEMLGWLRAVREEQVVSRFRTQKTAVLLAYLAYYLDRLHPRDALIELLWPEDDLEIGRSKLRQALISLRHQLEPSGTPRGGVLVTDRSSVRLNPDAVATDVRCFESSLRAADRAGSNSERAQRLRAAVEWYRGELLPGYFEEWPGSATRGDLPCGNLFPMEARRSEARREGAKFNGSVVRQR